MVACVMKLLSDACFVACREKGQKFETCTSIDHMEVQVSNDTESTHQIHSPNDVMYTSRRASTKLVKRIVKFETLKF